MSATEQTINYMVVSEVFLINQLLEQDLENLLTQPQTQFAIDNGNYSGTSGTFTCNLNTSNNRAVSMTFPTIAFPDSTMNAGDPNDTDVIEVTYNLVATGDSVDIPVSNVIQRRPSFSLFRIVDGDTTSSSKPYITSFRVQFVRSGSNIFEPVDTVSPTVTNCGTDLSKVRFEFSLAAEGVEFIAQDQRSTSRHNMSQFGATVNLTNWE